MQHGSLIACECCHGGGEMIEGRTTAIYPREEYPRRLTMEDYCSAVDTFAPGQSLSMQEEIAKELGWKFRSCLTELPYFDMINCCVEDYLHRLPLGVCAQLTAATFGRKNQKISRLQLPEPIAKLVSERAVMLSAQLPKEYHTYLRYPLTSWQWYNGTVLCVCMCVYVCVCVCVCVRACVHACICMRPDLRY